MSEPARNHLSHDAGSRTPNAGPLRDWLAAMRAVAPEARPSESRGADPSAFDASEDRPTAWAPRLVTPTPQPEARDDDIAEIVAENLMLKAKLRLEAERRDELQILLAQEIRDMRAHIDREIESLEDLRAERDLWKARCEALMEPLFQTGQRR